MKAIYSLMLSASVASTIMTQANPQEPEEAYPSTFTMFSIDSDHLITEAEPLDGSLSEEDNQFVLSFGNPEDLAENETPLLNEGEAPNDGSSLASNEAEKHVKSADEAENEQEEETFLFTKTQDNEALEKSGSPESLLEQDFNFVSSASDSEHFEYSDLDSEELSALFGDEPAVIEDFPDSAISTNFDPEPILDFVKPPTEKAAAAGQGSFQAPKLVGKDLLDEGLEFATAVDANAAKMPSPETESLTQHETNDVELEVDLYLSHPIENGTVATGEFSDNVLASPSPDDNDKDSEYSTQTSVPNKIQQDFSPDALASKVSEASFEEEADLPTSFSSEKKLAPLEYKAPEKIDSLSRNTSSLNETLATSSVSPEQVEMAQESPDFFDIHQESKNKMTGMIEESKKNNVLSDITDEELFQAQETFTSSSKQSSLHKDDSTALRDTDKSNHQKIPSIALSLDKDANHLMGQMKKSREEPKTTNTKYDVNLISEDELSEFDSSDALEARSETEASGIGKNAQLKSYKNEKGSQFFTIDLKKAFSGSPAIYSLLLVMSIGTFGIWSYNLLSLKNSSDTPESLIKNLRGKLIANQYDEALNICLQHDSFFCRMVVSGISSRKFGPQVMVESMKAEGKRSTVSFWQRLSVLNDIAIIAPMLGLLGTVVGMFYAFYDLNRSTESVTTLFDGLGVSVGTTVAGLIVAILALILQSIGRYRLVKVLAKVENEAHSMAAMIDSKVAFFEDK